MTKQKYRMLCRLSPVGEKGIEQIRKVVESKTYAKVNEVLMDTYSASIILSVYDAASEANKERLRGVSVQKLYDVCATTYENVRQNRV